MTTSVFEPGRSEVVIGRHTNVLRPWADRLREAGFRVRVYEKHPVLAALGRPYVPHFVPRNRGNEASAYLAYVIERYDCLPEWVVFLHDHETSWHQSGSVVDALRAMAGRPVPGGLQSLNVFVMGSIRKNPLWPQILRWFRAYLEPHLGPPEALGDWTVGHPGCSQFVVHRDNIRQRPLDMYRRLLRWLLTTELTDAVSGRFLEWTWHLIWATPR